VGVGAVGFMRLASAVSVLRGRTPGMGRYFLLLKQCVDCLTMRMHVFFYFYGRVKSWRVLLLHSTPFVSGLAFYFSSLLSALSRSIPSTFA
jgi:hypothetical protein